MRVQLSEAEYIRHTDDALEQLESKESLLSQAKELLFSVFFRLNTLKIPLAQHYIVLLILFESAHQMSLLLNDGLYQSLGPYGSSSPWNLEQTQWLIDLLWVFRVDHYLRSSALFFLLLTLLCASLVGTVILLMLFLCWYQKPTNLSKYLLRTLKVCITLTTNVLFIPICDTLAFGLRCSIREESVCLGLTAGYQSMIGFMAALIVYLSVACLCGLLYFELCMYCGGVSSKPHSRFKCVRLVCFAAVVLTQYFVETSGKQVVFLLVALCVGALQCYVYIQYVPYYQLLLCKIRLATAVAFTSASFCMLIGQFFNSTTQTTSSVSMLFYFLTPCLIQTSNLCVSKRCRSLSTRKFQQLTNIYQVEIKGRMLAFELETARKHSLKTMYGEAEEDADQTFTETLTRVRSELESLYNEAFRKFPNSELLYLWSGLLQLHVSRNYILAIVQCFKGQKLATKLDTQYAFNHFRKTSEAMYKANMKDDALDYVLCEKASALASHNDELLTRAQYALWTELEAKTPKIRKLVSLSTAIAQLIELTRTSYTRLLKLNSKSTQILRMYGSFLSTLCNYAEQGQNCLTKADLQDDAKLKASMLPNNVNQSLSFFDTESGIISLCGDFENTGEITKVNNSAGGIFGYLQTEMIGRNIAMVIPSPFAEVHDQYVEQFHSSGSYKVIDSQQLVLPFLTKSSHLVECRALVKVLPNDTEPPYIIAALKHVKSSWDVALVSKDLVITAYSTGFGDKFGLISGKGIEVKVKSLIPRFQELRENMVNNTVEIEQMHESRILHLKCRIVPFALGDSGSFFIHIEDQNIDRISEEEEIPPPRTSRNSEYDPHESESAPASTSSPKVATSQSGKSESESEDSSSSSSDEIRTEHQSALDAKRISFPLDSAPAEEDVSASEESDDISGSNSEAEAPKGEGDGQSVYSSSKSVNSSLTSQAQFLKAVKALVVFEYEHTQKYVFRFKATLMVTIILLIVMSVTTFQVIGSASQRSEELRGYVNLVGDLRLYAQSLSYYARMLELADSGLLPGNRSTYVQWLRTDSDSMHAINLQLYQNYELLSDADQKSYISRTIPMWSLEVKTIHSDLVNLFDATGNLVLQSFLLGRDLDSVSVDMTQRRPFFIYRNGMGESLTGLNASAQFYIRATLSNLDHERLVAILLIVASVLLLLFCAGFAVIPTIITLERSKAEVWEVMFEIPPYVCRLMKGKCNDRLELLGESNNAEEFHNPEAQAEEHPEDSEKHTTKDQLASKTPAKKALTYDPRQRKLLGLKLLSYFLISVVYFYMIYYTGFEAVGAIMREAPTTLNWASRRKQLTRAVNHWLTEAVLENVTAHGYKFLVTQSQQLGSPLRQAVTAINELEAVENSLIFGNTDQDLSFASVRGSQQETLLFEDACIAPALRSGPDCASIADGTLKHGLHSAMGLYMTLGRTVALQLSKSENNISTAAYLSGAEFTLVRALADSYLYDPLNYSSQLYEQDFSERQSGMTIWQNLLMALYTIFALLFYALIFHPMITKIGRDTNDAWSLCVLLPQEYQEEFHKLSTAIKERRDNFKWR